MHRSRRKELDVLAVALVVTDCEGRGRLEGAVGVFGVLAHDGDAMLTAGVDANGLTIRLEYDFRGRTILRSGCDTLSLTKPAC